MSPGDIELAGNIGKGGSSVFYKQVEQGGIQIVQSRFNPQIKLKLVRSSQEYHFSFRAVILLNRENAMALAVAILSAGQTMINCRPLIFGPFAGFSRERTFRFNFIHILNL